MSVGRHRSFDKDIALDAAVDLFWKKGYTGTSLSDLTNAMGINKPSLYSAFGNKEELFKSALNKYVQTYGEHHVKELFSSNKSLQKRLLSYLKSMAEMLSDPSMPGGCMITTSTCEAGGNCLPSGAFLAVSRINDQTKKALTEFFSSEISLGNLNENCSAEILANYLFTLQFGLAVMARNGAKQEELNRVIKYAVSTFKP